MSLLYGYLHMFIVGMVTQVRFFTFSGAHYLDLVGV